MNPHSYSCDPIEKGKKKNAKDINALFAIVNRVKATITGKRKQRTKGEYPASVEESRIVSSGLVPVFGRIESGLSEKKRASKNV